MTSVVAFDSPQRARARNRRLILDVVQSSGGITRAQLGAIIKLSKTAIKEICDDLITEGLLEEFAPEPAKRGQGRPALGLRVATKHGLLLGIDIGADKVHARVASLTGEIVASREIRTRREKPDRKYLLSLVAKSVAAIGAEDGLSGVDFHTVVVSTPGVVDPKTQVVSLAPQILGWDGTDLQAAIADCLDIDTERVFVERQTDLSVLAESIAGAAKGIDTVLYVHLGIGIGGGIIVGGRLCTGALGAAGELGYLPLSFGDEPPVGSGIGAWEWAAGGRAWARHGRSAAMEPGGARLRELAGGDPDDVDAEVIFRGVHEGDAAALAVFNRMTRRIAAGIASAVCVINPECVLIAGGLSRGGDLLIEALRAEVNDLVPIKPNMRLAAFGADGGVVGAIFKATERALDALNPLP
ncbi:ROK family protein [Mycolicibacterium sp. CBM1]